MLIKDFTRVVGVYVEAVPKDDTRVSAATLFCKKPTYVAAADLSLFETSFYESPLLVKVSELKVTRGAPSISINPYPPVPKFPI
jgi:hypothetical protein